MTEKMEKRTSPKEERRISNLINWHEVREKRRDEGEDEA
jgi:hypothetical protein